MDPAVDIGTCLAYGNSNKKARAEVITVLLAIGMTSKYNGTVVERLVTVTLMVLLIGMYFR